MLIPELDIILLSAKNNPSIEDIDALNKIIPKLDNWDYLSSTLINRGLAPLLYKKLSQLSNSHLIPAHIQSKLRSAYYKTVSRSMMLYGAFHEVVQEFNNAGIKVIALKGIYLSEHLYGDIGLRLMSDIDLLVKEEDKIKCIKILESLKYTTLPTVKNFTEFIDTIHEDAKENSGQAHYEPMLKGEISIEIHTKLQSSSEKYHQSLTDIWENAKPVTINGLPALALDNYNLLIHLCLHLHKHNVVLEHVQFTSFADIVNLLCRFDNRRQTTDNGLPPSPLKGEQEEHPLGRGANGFVWEEFIAKCKAYKCEEPVFKYLLLCRAYFNAPLPDYLYEAYKHTFTDEDRDLFYKHLTGFDFAAARDNSAVPVHFRNIKHIKNPILKLRYVVEVVFPGKAFMIQKYGLQSKEQRAKIKDGKKNTSAYHHIITSKFWWLWYPYRYYCGLKGFWYVVRGTSTSSVTSTEKKKEN